MDTYKWGNLEKKFLDIQDVPYVKLTELTHLMCIDKHEGLGLYLPVCLLSIVV